MQTAEFTAGWWLRLAGLGTALSFTISTKFVGLFMVLYAGAATAADLWQLAGDLKVEGWKQTRVVIHCYLYRWGLAGWGGTWLPG